MWTPAARAKLARESLPYATSLSDAEWAVLAPLLPAPSSTGRPWRRPLRAVFDGKRYHYDSHEQLRAHLADFVSAYNFGRRLKTLRGLTPYEAICKAWSAEPSRFRSSPLHQIPGPNT